MAAATTTRTHLTFQHNAKLHTLQTTILAILPYTTLPEPNRQLFKQGTTEKEKEEEEEVYHAVVTEQTIFHPQGGGQPSDVGTMTFTSARFEVLAVRMDAVHDGQVLHFGRFSSVETSSFQILVGEEKKVTQEIDAEKRLLYSRLHTAGHVLGAAVKSLVEEKVEGFEELKASHFPDSAACEFRGLIEGKWKPAIQEKVDEYVRAGMEVEVEWWDEEDFRRRGMERLIPDRSLVPPGEKFRVVNIVGAEVYPCGGTHVDRTDLCGETKVKKISRSKGTSRVSYTVAE